MTSYLKAVQIDEIQESQPTSMAPAGPSPGMELDIRGKRVEDGLEALERYLEAAFLAHLPWVRIIHGKGTGKAA